MCLHIVLRHLIPLISDASMRYKAIKHMSGRLAQTTYPACVGSKWIPIMHRCRDRKLAHRNTCGDYTRYLTFSMSTQSRAKPLLLLHCLSVLSCPNIYVSNHKSGSVYFERTDKVD